MSADPATPAESEDPSKAKCNAFIEKGLQRNPTVQFLLKKLVDMGCQPPAGFISCVDCGPKLAGGGFGMVEETTINASQGSQVSGPQCQRSFADLQRQLQAEKDGHSQLRLVPEIYICHNNVRGESHAHLTMIHELIHAIDMCRTNMDPLHNCVQLACTEIRAENLSGECGIWSEAIAGRVQNVPKHGQQCVKRRAVLSVKANPNCRDQAHEFVDAAFERCYADTFPFDRHPNLR